MVLLTSMNLKQEIESLLGEKIKSENTLGGGCIGNAMRINVESGKTFFVKTYPGSGSQILRNEANGLRELAKANAIKIPEVIAFNEKVIVLEFIESGSKSRNFMERFGQEFAGMHRLKAEQYGFFENNFIGSNPQINQPVQKDWLAFYWDNRLLYQIKLAEKNGYLNSEFRTACGKLESVLPKILSGSEEEPCVLHGDLWGGNYMVADDGSPVLIDPAVYYGHREADLGMTRLFGGFDSNFYSAYNEAYPLPEGWDYRIDIYKLYHVLNHLNLFGTGYYSQANSIIQKYIR